MKEMEITLNTPCYDLMMACSSSTLAIVMCLLHFEGEKIQLNIKNGLISIHYHGVGWDILHMTIY